MVDLNQLPIELMLLRGQFATIRSMHEDGKKELQQLCGKLGSISAQILRAMQPENDGAPSDVCSLLDNARTTLDNIEIASMLIASLAKQRAELKPKAWGKP